MADVATLGIVVELKNGELVTRQLTDLEKAAAAADKSAGGLTSQMKSLAAAFAVFESVKWAQETVNLGARYETLGVVMDVVGRNAGKTRGQMADFQVSLEKTGISMIGARESLAKMAGAQLDLAESSRLARVAQDAAVIANVNSTAAFETLIQGITTGQPRVLRTLGIFVDFNEVHKKFAEGLHKSVDDLTEADKHQANLNAVMNAGVKIAGTYEAAMGTAGKQLLSTVRYLEDAKVKASQAFLPEYTKLVFDYANALKYLGDRAPQVVGGLVGIATAIVGIGVAIKGAAIAEFVAKLASPEFAAAAIIIGELAVIFGKTAEAAALERKEVADAAEMLKHMNNATLEHAIASAKAQLATTTSIEQFAHLTGIVEQYTAALKANQAGQVAKAAEDDAMSDKTRNKIAEIDAEAAKVRGLNEHYMESALALQVLGIQLDAAVKKAQLHKEAKQNEFKAIDDAVDALAREQVAQAKLNAQKQSGQDLIALQATNDAMVQAARDAGDLADANELVSLAQLKGANAVADAQKAYDHLQIALEANAKITEAQVTLKKALVGATEQEADAARAQYNSTLRAINQTKDIKDATVDRISQMEALKRVLTDVDDVMSAAFDNGTNAIEKMGQALAKLFDTLSSFNSSFGKLAAGAAGGAAGFGIGQQFGESAGGVGAKSILGAGLAGGATGALAGSAILPGIGTIIGAAVGELTGMVGAFVAGTKAARERKESEDALRTSLALSVNQMRVSVGQATALSQTLLQNAADFKKLRDDNDAAFAGLKNQGQRESQLREINALEAVRVQQLKDEAAIERLLFAESLAVRNLRAAGMDAEADALAQQIADQKELNALAAQYGKNSIEYMQTLATQSAEAAKRERDRVAAENNAIFQAFSDKNQGAFNASLAALNATAAENKRQTDLLNAQISIAKDALDINQKQLDAQRQTVDSLNKTIASLQQTRDALKVSPLSTLSPRQQLDEAQRQFSAQLSKAMQGDQVAAQGLGGFANTYLQASRAYNASGAGYVKDYNSVQAALGAVQDQFQAQQDTNQLILVQLENANATLARQVGVMTAQLATLIKLATPYVVGTPQDPNFEHLIYQWTGGVFGTPGTGGGVPGTGASGGSSSGGTSTNPNTNGPPPGYVWDDIAGAYVDPSTGGQYTGSALLAAVNDLVSATQEQTKAILLANMN